MDLFSDPAQWLPVAFAVLMGLSILLYVILDGYDLGVGVLLPLADEAEKDRMIAAIGPFWDANETWLVMAVGLLLVAFPAAHGTVLTALYLPVFIMLIGLILRGIAFEFRAKVRPEHKAHWNSAFFAGSLMTTLSQGFMLGLYVTGLQWSLGSVAFGLLIAACLTAAYAFIGACWIIVKTDSLLQLKAVKWARRGLVGVIAGFSAISIVTPLASPRIFEKWFSVPEIIALAPLPLLSGALVVMLFIALKNMPDSQDRWTWLPFAGACSLFTLAFAGLAYSFYPYVVPEQLTIYEAASAPESLMIILIGALIVLPVIAAYTALSYVIFRGKATSLSYD
jgi:cytochrome d ubiquinol oxidase subunit II